ncbi:helix-turn-helix domain-containing protein [Rhodococcus hoagii]|nr:helix-turn-helix domain-containing protein [Prescottella equi]
MNHLITLREAAARTGFSVDHLRRLVRAGDLAGYRRGARRIFVDPADVDAMTRPIEPTIAG